MTAADRARAALGTTADPARAVTCPWCRAPAGQPCTSRARSRHLTHTHPARQDAWAQQQEASRP